MNLEKMLFIFSIIGILFLLFYTNKAQPIQQGTISEIKYSENKITIQLENQEEILIIFENMLLDLKLGDKIQFQGREETYKNEKQIIVDKIRKIPN